MRALIACLIFLVGSAPLAATSAAAPGDVAPPLLLATAEGEPFDLSAYRGRVVYVDFWASWCAPCRKSFPWMNAMMERYQERGLSIVAVNLDEERAEARRFLVAAPARFTVVFDPRGQAARDWKLKGMPTSFLVGRNGTLLAVHTGFRDHETATREKEIADALGQTR